MLHFSMNANKATGKRIDKMILSASSTTSLKNQNKNIICG